MSDLYNLTIHEAMDALRRGDITSVALTQAVLERVLAVDNDICAYLTLTPEAALEQAEAADAARAAGKDAPLLGIPIALKDNISTQGIETTAGSKILDGYVPPFDATIVRKLKAAGAVVLGKTNLDEFAMGSSTENSAFFPTRNPWDVTRVPGGSSGGSAAAVAASMVPAALGTDTGGSVRQPASFCGITGIKPTYGRVSRYGLIAYGSSLDAAGVLARTAADAALILQFMAGYDPLDATSMDYPVPDYTPPSSGNLAGLRIGVPKEYFIEGIQPEVEKAVQEAIETLKRLGAAVQEVSLPYTEYALPVYYLIAPAEASANLARYDGVRFGLRHPTDNLLEMYCQTRGDGFGAEVKRRIMLGTYALSAGYYDAYYGQAQKVRTLIKADFDRAFESVDVIAAPVAPTTAFRFGQHADDPLAMYLEDIFTLPANLAGVPGLAFPVGFDADNLPIGMQLMGRHFDESTLLRAANAYQGVTGWHLRSPQEFA